VGHLEVDIDQFQSLLTVAATQTAAEHSNQTHPEKPPNKRWLTSKMANYYKQLK